MDHLYRVPPLLEPRQHVLALVVARLVVRPLAELLEVDARVGCENRFLGGFQAPFRSWRGPGTALNCSYRGDRVARAWPMGLRVRAAQTETRFGQVDGPKLQGMLPATGMESSMRGSSAAAIVVVHPPPLKPIMTTRL